jgi:hypothetical protein
MTIFHVIKFLPKSALDIQGIMCLPEPIYKEWLTRVNGKSGIDSFATEESFHILKEVLNDYDAL